MKKLRKLILTTLAASSLSTTLVYAQEQPDFVESCGGVGYEESICCPSLTPYIALCTVAAIGIVAIAIRHTGHGHSH